MNGREAIRRWLPFFVSALLVLPVASCGRRAAPPEEPSPVTRRPIAEVLHAHTGELTAIPGVVGTGEGESRGRPVIVVLVERRTPAIAARIPRAIEGYPVEIRETGKVRALGGR